MYRKETSIPLWEEMTWKEAEAILKQTDVCIVPTGAIEQHGHHLPLGCDTYIAQEIACRACAILKRKGITVAMGPTVPFGVHPEAMHYPGSVQLRPSTLNAILKDIAICLRNMGFKRILFLVGHDGNVPAMHMAVQELEIEENIDVMCVDWLLPHLPDQQRILPIEGIADGHGGARETSRALASFPELVKLDKAVPNVKPLAPPKKVACSGSPSLGGVVYHPIASGSMQYYPENCPGQDGDPAMADAKAGDALYDALGTWLAALMEQEYKLVPAQGKE